MAPATMRFETHANLPTEGATLIEGLPGHGMVASIAVEQIVDQLDMTHAASVESDAYFPILTYRDGGLQDAVRVYAHADASLLALMSDTAIPPDAFPALGETLVGELATRLSRAIFLVEVPTERGTEDGVVTAVGSTDDLRSSLLDASITIEREEGLLIGPTGALASAFYHAGVPTVVLLVKTGLDPFVPDPGGAKTLIDEALEPLVDFAIDTTPLAARAEAIRADMQSMATQLKHLSDGTGFVESTYDSMYQ
ncbi:Archaeal enzyme of ATP-grasp superfamily [Halanaeroarchaeum sp. HSR-CO]|uniref:proteasome assembly chaperone family protein n=1 Tax=Halanaeroarchaeum sp. HSR-CO TaxID=2866382 RepID=UPI00217CE356|nr:PAC2 family protein [Halanaeroarchaeum sp. HSR-CO]UWG46485.1 Archaeal enzyme of ATP-grasp superfamily [Halanaeroarchaeum sp. HSR-CO]